MKSRSKCNAAICQIENMETGGADMASSAAEQQTSRKVNLPAPWDPRAPRTP